MPGWHDQQRWRALIDGSGCPICRRGQPLHVVETLASSWLTLHEDAVLAGYACLVSRVHAVKLHELTADQSTAFFLDARRVSAPLIRATRAIKLNYQINGNTLPHLHVHLYPRHQGDAFEGRSIDPRNHQVSVYGPGEFDALREALLAELRTAT